MAEVERKKTSEDHRETDQRKRPVEFRSLSTHYVTGEKIRVSFRYPITSFSPKSEDQVKLYAVGTKDRSLASTTVGDPSKHRLCDGGLYKTGSVTVPATVRPGTDGKKYLLLYGSNGLRRVMGKSEPFIICRQEDFPSIKIRTKEDNEFIEQLRSHSPVGSAARDRDLSFVAVTGMKSEEWEVVEEEERRMESVGSWSDVGGGVGGKGEEMESKSLRKSNSSDSREHEGMMMLKNANKELRTKLRVLHDKLYSVSQEREGLEVRMEEVSVQLSQLHQDKTELKQRNKRLVEERQSLKTKNKQLVGENEILAKHCEKQVTQMAKYDAQLRSIATENLQLQQQLHLQTKSEPKSTQKSPSDHLSSALDQGVCKKKPIIDVTVRKGGESSGD